MTQDMPDFEREMSPVPAGSEHEPPAPERVDSSAENIATAENVLSVVANAPGEDTIGERIAEIAADASKFSKEHPTPETEGEAVVLADAEALAALKGEDGTGEAARDLGESPQLPAVLRDFAELDPTHEAPRAITRAIDDAELSKMTDNQLDAHFNKNLIEINEPDLTTMSDSELDDHFNSRPVEINEVGGFAVLGDAEVLTVESVERGEREVVKPTTVSKGATLLRLTAERPTLSLAKLEYQVPNAKDILAKVGSIEKPSMELRKIISKQSIDWLRTRDLRVDAPVPAGSIGVESFDKTQRDRKFFVAGETGGASKNESYCSQLYAQASNPEIRDEVIQSLEGKYILNFGGGNAKIGKELRDNGASSVRVTNIEPYPSESALADTEGDPIISANPARPGFVEQSGIEPHSADEILAVFSVPAYLGTSEEVSVLFNNIKTLLKPNGVTRISHLGFVGGSQEDSRAQTLIHELEKAAEEGYLVETVQLNGLDTLIMTAPPENETVESEASYNE